MLSILIAILAGVSIVIAQFFVSMMIDYMTFNLLLDKNLESLESQKVST